jgi:hypothetical protein
MKQFPIITEIEPEVLKGAMDAHALRLSIGFGYWLKHLDNGTTHFDPVTKEETSSIGFSPFDCFTDGTMPIEQLYSEFIKYISCKNVNPDAYANLIKKPENQ